MTRIPALAILLILVSAAGAVDPGEAVVLDSILKGFSNGEVLGWNGGDPCGWKHITCRGQSIVAIGAESLGLQGTLSAEISKLSNLEHLGFQFNSLSGPLPSLAGLKSLEKIYLNSNNFSSIPPDFFSGLDSLLYIYLDHNPLASWSLPSDVQSSTKLVNLSLTNTSLSGKIPDFLGQMPSLRVLNLAYNSLTGSLPATFAGSGLSQLEVNNMALVGPIDVVGSMPSISQLWLHMNQFNGTIPPGLSNASSLADLRLNNNKLTGLLPNLNGLPLTGFNVADNNLMGPIPVLDVSTKDAFVNNKFCQSQAGKPCPADVNSVLSFLSGVAFPDSLISSWTGTEACTLPGVICSRSNVVVGLNYPNSQLAGAISSGIAGLASLESIVLSNNRFTGSIPPELTTLKSLKMLDLRNNSLSGPMIKFDHNVTVLLDGNPLLNSPPAESPPATNVPVPVPSQLPPPSPPAEAPPSVSPPVTFNDTSSRESTRSSVPTAVVVAVPVAAGVSLALVAGVVVFLLCCKQRKGKGGSSSRSSANGGKVVYPSSDPDIQVNVSRGSGGGSVGGPSGDVHVVESGNMVISIQVLRHATKNFSEETILGRGGFGVVYKGMLDDGTSIAVKRMEASTVVSSKGLSEFQAEIAVLTKVRHRHLVALLGYCIEGNEKLLVYEYLSQGTLGQHLFENEKLGYKGLDWKKRVVIALDVARGMEYLHGLAHMSFIHRDLKPSNILLDDDYRAKVSDFGLVKLAPEGKHSVETRLAGTFGYLAPEYAVTGRVTTKADVFSFGVVLMELITGRKALDETQPEENMHLVTWFKRTNQNRESFLRIIDPALETTEDKVESIYKVAELAKHCTAREPYNRPDMGHAVNVLAPLVDQWKPTDTEGEESKGIDLSIPLPQALKQWQASDDSNLDDSQASLPTRPVGFADSFTSTDAR